MHSMPNCQHFIDAGSQSPSLLRWALINASDRNARLLYPTNHTVNIMSDRGSSSMCDVCGVRPKYKDTFTTHAFCGRTCAQKAPKCLSPRCTQKGQKQYAGYCSVSHQSSAFCKQCRTTRADTDGLCSLCYRKREETMVHKFTRLSEVQRTHPDFLEVESRLQAAWAKKGRAPPLQVCRIIKVQPATEAEQARIAYARSLNEDPRGKPETYLTFYSNQCICDLGADNQPLSLCKFKSCGICKPLSSCFENLVFDKQAHEGRFGPGLYVNLDPKRADPHAISTTSSPYRVVIMSTAVLPFDPVTRSRTGKITKEYDFSPSDGCIRLSNDLSITPNFLIAYKRGLPL